MKYTFYIFLVVTICISCAKSEKTSISLASETKSNPYPNWLTDAITYQVNLRHFTPEGTFRAFESHIPRLKNLGVDVLWLLPIQPVSQSHQTGSAQNCYATKDYYGINEAFGTVEDLEHLISTIHEAGLHVIIDWEPNVTAFDNQLVEEHVDWYLKDAQGQFVSPDGGGQEIYQLDYSQEGLRDYMIAALKHWVDEYDVDGFRFGGANSIPSSFWRQAGSALKQSKDLFLLAEWEGGNKSKLFNATYTDELVKKLKLVSIGQEHAGLISSYLAGVPGRLASDDIKLNFTSNHELNANAGSVFERFGKASEAFAVLTYTIEGMPMIYSGQEVGLKRSLNLCGKDAIPWGDHPFNALYDRLGKLRKDNAALGNSSEQRSMVLLQNSNQQQILSFAREDEDNTVLALFNLSDRAASFQLIQDKFDGSYRRFKSRDRFELVSSQTLQLPAWGYEIYIR